MRDITTAELVQALRCDGNQTHDGCTSCSYQGKCLIATMMNDVADRLERQEQTIAALTARAEQAERERDAAVADLDALKDSGFCNSCVGCNAPHSESITYCTDWKRRGLPQEGERE
jgi:hypothetical protein